MAQTEGDEDAFIGRRLKGRRRPIDLSLGYYLNANEDIPMNNEHSNLDQSRRFLSSANTNQDVRPNQQAGIVLGTVLKENKLITKSKSSIPPLSQPSDPISVDHFLKSTSKVNTTRNYKQARKRKIKEKLLDNLNDTEDCQDSPGQAASTVKPLKKAGRTRARHLAATRDLSASGLRSRHITASSQLLHHRGQPVKNARIASVDNRIDTGAGDGLSIESNPPRKSRVSLLPPGWKKPTPQSGPSIKVPRKPTRVKALHDVARSALGFEPIEEHDKKLDLWLGSGSSHSTRRGAKQIAPFVRSVPPLTFSESRVLRNDQLNKKTPESVFNMLKAGNLSQNGGSVVSYPQQSGISADAGLKRPVGQTNQNILVPGQKLTHLGDMLGELRLSAKEFCHASGNVPSPG